MTRVKRGTTSRKRHNRLFSKTKGFVGLPQKRVKIAKNAVAKAGQHAYKGRKLRKRQMRSLWITRINAGCRAEGISYSKLVYGLLKARVAIDRKMIADLAVSNPNVFKQIVDKAKAAI